MNFKSFITKIISQSLLLFFIFIICAPSTIAQQTGLSLSPSLTEILSKPGNRSELTFSLENLGDPALVSLKILSTQPSDYFGNMDIQPNLKKPIEFSIQDYSLSTQKSFIMKTHEIRKLKLTFSIPQDTKEADYYYSLIAQTDPTPGQEGKVAARASISIVSNILISVLKNYPTTADAKIVLFDIPQSNLINIFGKKIRLVNSSQPFSTILTVKNTGIHRIKPEGSITLRSASGKIQSYVLPGQNILAQWQRTLQTYIQYRNGESSLTISSVPPGFYSLETVVGIPGTETTLRSKLEFMAIPFNLIYIIVFTLIILVIIVVLRKRRNHSDFESE